MCFSAARNSIAKRTRTDLVGYKFLKKRGNGLNSPYRSGTVWQTGKEVIADPFEKQASGYGSVNEGLHCYKSLRDALEAQGMSRKLYKVVIPAGSLVHKNDSQYCANRMILKRVSPIAQSTKLKAKRG